jgi:tetratricopeptide (TPR) repeat protein
VANIMQQAIDAHLAGDADRALELYNQTLAWTHHNQGLIHAQRDDIAEAEAAFRQAIRLAPNQPESRYSLAHLLLSVGRFAEGWALYEARRQLPRLKIPAGLADVPEWSGQDLAGKRLLMIGEQGYGDQIMFARFMAPLRERGATVTYYCGEALAGLFDGASASPAPADYWGLALSMPFRLGVALENLPAPAVVGVERRSGGGIGVTPTGSPGNNRDRHRSLRGADVDALLALGRDLRPEATGARNFLETAEIIAGLDLVITVDTSVAHLAGSMGVPVWTMLPAVGADWRWLRQGETTPWYPSMRLFRQSTPGDWSGVLQSIRHNLAAGRPRA